MAKHARTQEVYQKKKRKIDYKVLICKVHVCSLFIDRVRSATDSVGLTKLFVRLKQKIFPDFWSMKKN